MKTFSSGKDQNVVDVKYLPVEGECSPNNISETTPGQGFNESDNLIKCDSQLASSFQEVKIVKSRLKPGHYLQRVFLHKLKSQSVPILDKDKIVNQVRESNESVCDEVVPPVSQAGGEATEECESWYRTWPDRTGTGEKSKNGFVVNMGGSSDGAPERSVVRLNSAVPLDNLLEALPLAYSPITKQIHLISRSDVRPDPKCEVSQSPTDPKCDVSEGPTDPVWDVPLGLTDPKCDEPPSDLHRVNTELGSFSSTLSSLSDVSPSTNGDSAVSNLFDTADNCSLLSIGNCSIVSEDSAVSKPKRKGLSGFLSRGVLGWKGRGEGWTLFGRPAATRASSPSLPLVGTTGLIQLERPAWLPAKPSQEHKAHLDQHDRILQALRNKEVKEAKLRERQARSQLRAEDQLVAAGRVWTQEILPHWPHTRDEKRTRELWWEGVPPCVRGRLWSLAISNDLNLTHHLYHICLQRAEERLRGGAGSDSPPGSGTGREASMELIQLDISRTFPHLAIFQKSGPYYEWLHGLLAAYVCYRPDVGYVQGMSFLAAMLILNMDPPEAFVCFANLLNRPCLRAFYSLDQTQMESYFGVYEELLRENLPRLCAHLSACGLSPDLYLLDWVYTVFSRAMNIELASRIWDLFLRDGDQFIFRAAIGVLKTCEDALMTMDFVTGSQYLTKLPDLEPTLLFSKIASVRTSVGKLTFQDLLSQHSQSPPVAPETPR